MPLPKAQGTEESKDLTGVLIGMGNPLLDISAPVEQDILDKYGLKMNNAIMSEAKHMPIYQELRDNYTVDYVAGGATQNSIRVAQWMLQSPDATGFIGCVGKDSFGAELRKAAEADGVAAHYLEDAKEPTGTCAVLVHQKERSLVANLAAANCYKLAHLQGEEFRQQWQKASFFYVAGFFLTVSVESLLEMARHASANGKTLILNLSAVFICKAFTKQLLEVLPYVDVLFGNESEAVALGEALELDDTSVQGVARAVARRPKTGRPGRTVVITQGAEATVVARAESEAAEASCEVFPVPDLDRALIVDTNGAGDSFVGGFLSQLVRGRALARCVQAGFYAAEQIIQVSGCVMPKHAPPAEYL